MRPVLVYALVVTAGLSLFLAADPVARQLPWHVWANFMAVVAGVLLLGGWIGYSGAHDEVRSLGKDLMVARSRVAKLRQVCIEQDRAGLDDERNIASLERECDDLLDTIDRARDLLARGFVRDAQHELERELERYA